MDFNQTRTPSPTDDKVLIYPRSTFIRQCCFSCEKLEYTVHTMYTRYPRYVLNICDDVKCLERGREGLRSFLYNSTAYFIIEEMIDNVTVMRSSGEIEKDWTVVGLWLKKNEFPDVHVVQYDKNYSKDIRGEDFLQNNPDLENMILEYRDKIIEKYMKMI